LAAFLWPLTRILALIATAPILGNPGVPKRVKLGLALMITLAVAPNLGEMPPVDPNSLAGLLILGQQIVIGVAMGLTIRIIFVAIEMAGELVGLQMGLGFATFFNPQTKGFTPVVGQFLGILAALTFLALDGHLQIIAVLAESFSTLPVSAEPLAANGFKVFVDQGSKIFAAGLLLSLPPMAALLMTNLTLGILTRAAPQLNSFPITLAIGMVTLALSLPYFAPVMERLFIEGLQMMLHVSSQFRATPP
jgi:flagellar biosynthetic protein FliR